MLLKISKKYLRISLSIVDFGNFDIVKNGNVFFFNLI